MKGSWTAGLTLAAAAALAVALTVATFALGDEPAPGKAQDAAKPKIQVAILLDTSNSMDGLINQARTQLWKVVNEFAKTRLAGKEPTLEVALFEYGNDGLPAAEGHIRLVVPMTGDLDKVSQEMFALKTNGGQEYCGWVIDKAVKTLAWSNSEKDLKCIFIAGNEPFTQGTVDYHTSCKAAADKGITVSTIFCGDHAEGINTHWADGAKLADGTYLSINQNEAVAEINSPQDRELAQLSAELSTTYVPYGEAERRREMADRQKKQDENAAQSAITAAAARAAFKASGQYRSGEWDLVEAVKDGKVKLSELKDDQLPEDVRKLSEGDRKAYVEKMAAKRKEIQAKIQQLTAARDKYVASEKAKMAPAAAAKMEKQFDAAVIRAVEEAAKKK